MKQFENIVRSIPEKILVVLIDMIEFNKYHSWINSVTWWAYTSRFDKIQKDSERRWILRTLDFMKDIFVKAMPDHQVATDPLTWIELEKLQKELSQWFEDRRAYMMDLIKKFWAKEDWQKQEKIDNSWNDTK